jgi:hypothetical protein
VHDFADSLGAINVDQNAFDRSDFHNLIFRPQGINWFSRLMVREGGSGRRIRSVLPRVRTRAMRRLKNAESDFEDRRLPPTAPMTSLVLGFAPHTQVGSGVNPLGCLIGRNCFAEIKALPILTAALDDVLHRLRVLDTLDDCRQTQTPRQVDD